MKRWLFACTWLAATASAGALQNTVLLYEGNTAKRWEQTDERLRDLLFCRDRTGSERPFFRSLVLLELMTADGKQFTAGFSAKSATQQDWQNLLNLWMAGVLPKLNTLASRERISLDIWLAIPEPLAVKEGWGRVDGKDLTLSGDLERVAAVRWYVDTALRQFNRRTWPTLNLRGFYWLDEGARGYEDILPFINKYIHSIGKETLWIPYWVSRNKMHGEALGFDHVVLQPNYYVKKDVPEVRLDQAIRMSRVLSTGLEIEFDERLLSLPEQVTKAQAYLRHYRQQKIWGPFVIYQGGKGLSLAARATDPTVQGFYQDLCGLVSVPDERSTP